MSAVFSNREGDAEDSWGGKGGSGDHLIHRPAHSSLGQSRMLRAVAGWALGISKDET